MIEMKVEVDNVQEVKKRLGVLCNKAPSVIANAINRTVTNVKKNMAQETVQRYYTTSTEVKKTIKTSRATKTNLSGAAISRASPIALSKFKVSPNRPINYSRGKVSPNVYKVSEKKGEERNPLNVNPKAFIAVMGSGHKGVFRRESSAAMPIKQLFGPSVPQMLKNAQIMGRVQEEAKNTLKKRIDAEIENILRRK